MLKYLSQKPVFSKLAFEAESICLENNVRTNKSGLRLLTEKIPVRFLFSLG